MGRLQSRCGMAGFAVSCAAIMLVAACDHRSVGMDHDGGLPDVPDASVTGAPRWAMTGANARRNGRSIFVGPSAGEMEPEHAVVILASADGYDTTTAVNAVGPDGAVFVHLRDADQHGQVLSLRPDGEVRWVFPDEPVAVLGGLALSVAGQLTFEGRIVVEGTDPGWPDLFAFVNLTVDADLRWA